MQRNRGAFEFNGIRALFVLVDDVFVCYLDLGLRLSGAITHSKLFEQFNFCIFTDEILTQVDRLQSE